MVADAVAQVRRFNRFYTRLVGALDEGHLHSSFSLAETRVLYELAHGEALTATELGRDLRLDAGYLSRILRGFVRRGLVERAPSPTDARRSLLQLTPKGRSTFDDLDTRASEVVAHVLQPLVDRQRRELLDSMRAIQTLLGRPATDPQRQQVPFVLRPHRPGDMGWVVHRQAVLYAQEYGWDERYEALISRIVADFIDRFDPRRERCWIAERDGESVGSVFLIKHPERVGVAQLRLLYVERHARGLGVGRRLVSECTHFARQTGYKAITLWTNSVLTSARKIYEAEGYRLVREEPHHSFGHDLVGQIWELEL
ncbi:MAG: helix-turn-helix domain-containing GNAT family N-acetyltransferase [Gemmatimonadota bacterium]|nr:helix-turn-helix domain-containing GNAT family N-acetyltransferase [Gemmatimonadota bacterium]